MRTMSALVCATLGAGLAACGAGGDQIAGAGSSAQAAAMEAWTAGFHRDHADATVTYDPIGSGGGREQFAAGGIAFGGSDAALEDVELEAAQQRCGGEDNLIEMPAYVSPIAIAYNLDGVDALRLSPPTLAGMLKGEITRWDDPAIARTNPDVRLPAQRVTVVHRSDESGTTENLVDYLASVAPRVWDFEVSGDWPVSGQEAAQGNAGVVDAIASGQGTIGYADASQVRDLGVASIQVGEEFVAPTPEAAAAILDASEQTDDPGRYVFTYDLARDTKRSGTYPIVLLSYEMACTRYKSAEDAALAKTFLGYVISEDGQALASRAAGSAPISNALRQDLQRAVDAIGPRF